MIEVSGLSKSFGTRALWSNLSFVVSREEMLALVGPSGSGKSTLLNCIGLLEHVSAGQIRVDGKDITRYSARAQRRFRRDKLGYLFQNYALIDDADIDFNLRIAIPSVRRAAQNGIIESALREVGLAGRRKESVYRLSGGEQQRLALARLIVKQPAIILADEPTGALDEYNSEMVVGHLRRMAESGCAVIIATHSTNVEKSCDSTLSVGLEDVEVVSEKGQ